MFVVLLVRMRCRAGLVVWVVCLTTTRHRGRPEVGCVVLERRWRRADARRERNRGKL